MEQLFSIYGLRSKGSKEVRYIGQTGKPIDVRLDGHFVWARRGGGRPGMGDNPGLAQWLAGHEREIEAFKIGYVDTRSEALTMERAVTALCLRLDHRLLNLRPVI